MTTSILPRRVSNPLAVAILRPRRPSRNTRWRSAASLLRDYLLLPSLGIQCPVYFVRVVLCSRSKEADYFLQ